MSGKIKVQKVKHVGVTRKCDDETFVRVWETYASKGRRLIADALGMTVVSINARYKKLTSCGVRLSEPAKIRRIVDVKKLNQLAEQTRQSVEQPAATPHAPQKSRVIVSEAYRPPLPRPRAMSALEPVSDEA